MVQFSRALLLTSAITLPASAQVTFTKWDFNAAGLSPTSPTPVFANQGYGTAHQIGGTLPANIGAYLSNVGSTDPVMGSAWHTGNFPAQGMNSGTAGIEFRTSAAGYASVSFEMDLRPSGRFSDFYQIEYSIDQGQSWTSFTSEPIQNPGDTDATAFVWTNNLGASPAFNLPATAAGSGDVRVRLVTVFSPLLGNAYAPNSPFNSVGAPQTYITTGSVRVDMIEFKGIAAASTAPSIDGAASAVIPAQTCAGVATPIELDVRVAPGTVPASTSAIVLVDTTSIGGGPGVAMVPAGVDGSGRMRFTLATSVAPGGPNGVRSLPIVATDNLSRSASGSVSLTVGVCCYADLDNDGLHANGSAPDGGVDINDLLFFLTGFEAGATDVDLDNDGEPAVGTPDGGVDINDLLFFLARFEQGC